MKLISNTFILLLSVVVFNCNSDDLEQIQNNPCDSGIQGMSLSSYNQVDNFQIDDQALTVHYVTGHPQGDYFHIFNNNGPTLTNFYTFAINNGDTSTLDQNWNTTAGSFLSIDNNPFYGTQQYPTSLTTVEGGSQVGDNIVIDFSGYIGGENGMQYIEGQYCVSIDAVITAADYVYVTDGSDFKIINVFDPYLPYVMNTIPASSSYIVEVINNKAYVGYFDAIQPFLEVYDVTNSQSLNTVQSIAKSGQYGRVSDVVNVGDYIYISDEYKGIHHIDVNSSAVTSFETHDVMSLSVLNNKLTALGIWAGLYGFDVTAPSTPVNLNYTLDTYTAIDIASYPYTTGSFHSWIRNNGTHHFVANISDQKLKKVAANSTNYSVINELGISGYVTAFTTVSNYGFITTRASTQAPLQTSNDGVLMVDLSNMTLVDFQGLDTASGVAVKANIVYVTDANGLHIYDVSQGDLNLINTYAQGFGNYISINK